MTSQDQPDQQTTGADAPTQNSQAQHPQLTNQQKPWGGSRPGAGRKPNSPEGRRTARNFTATGPEWQRIKENAKKAGFLNVSEYIRSKTL